MDYVTEVFIHEDDESQSKGTPEPSNRDDSSPKVKQASKSKVNQLSISFKIYEYF
jgi:hypothetical protein